MKTLELSQPEEKRGDEKLASFGGIFGGLSCAGTRLEQIWDNKQAAGLKIK